MTDLSDSTKFDLPAVNRLGSDQVNDPVGSLVNSEDVDVSLLQHGVIWEQLAGGRFQPRKLLGRGGFATVYRAYDHKLKRDVALKIPHLGSLADDSSQQWLRREGLANAALHHPHIVHLYDFEVSDRECYLVSELVEGQTLSQFIQQHPQGCHPRVAAEIVMLLAEGVQQAHSKGILHRDIKPANILLDYQSKAGELPFSPRLADFGLATAPTLETLSKKADGIMGSIHYIPPEMIKGASEGYTAQGDIYALALVLRELLTGTRAASGDNVSQILKQIAEGQFEDLPAVRSKIPHDLLAICLQAMDIDPHRRYLSAELLADDLRRYLDGRPVRARTRGRLERSWQWMRRNPTLTTSMAIFGLALISITILVISHDFKVAKLNSELNGRNKLLERSLLESEAARNHNEQIIYSHDMAAASLDLQRNNFRGVRAILDRYQTEATLRKHRDADWHLLNKRIQKYQPRMLWQAPHALYVSCVNIPENVIYVGGAGPQIAEIDVRWDGSFVRQTWNSQQVEINALLLSPDERTVWSSGYDGTVCAWDLRNYQLKWRTQAFDSPVEAYNLIYLQDLERLVVLSSKDELRFLSAQDGQLITDLVSPSFQCSTIVNSNDGRHFLLGDYQRRLVLMDGANMQVVQELGLTSRIRAIATSPDGRWATIVTNANAVVLVDLVEWSVSDSIKSMDAPRNICFVNITGVLSQNDPYRFVVVTLLGEFIEFTVGDEGKLIERDRWISAGQRFRSIFKNPLSQEMCTLDDAGRLLDWSKLGHDWQVDNRIKMQSLEGHLLVTATNDRDNTRERDAGNLFFQSNSEGLDLLSRNHKRVVLWCSAKSAAICDVGKSGLWIVEQPYYARSVDWKQLLQIFSNEIPSIKAKKRELPWQEHALPNRADLFGDLATLNLRLAASSDGNWIAGWDAEAKCVWSMPPDRPEQVKRHSADEVTLVWFEPASHRCWWVSKARKVYRWNLADGSQPQKIFETPNLLVKDLAISPDKSLLAMVTDQKSCFVLNIENRSIEREYLLENPVRDVTFSTSGKTLVVLDLFGGIVCWNMSSGRKTFEEAYSDTVNPGGFSGDARYLIRSRDNNWWYVESLADADELAP
jgi:serine/threonine protein kinase